MYYTREQHKRFLDKELTAISEEYLKKLNSKGKPPIQRKVG